MQEEIRGAEARRGHRTGGAGPLRARIRWLRGGERCSYETALLHVPLGRLTARERQEIGTQFFCDIESSFSIITDKNNS